MMVQNSVTSQRFIEENMAECSSHVFNIPVSTTYTVNIYPFIKRIYVHKWEKQWKCAKTKDLMGLSWWLKWLKNPPAMQKAQVPSLGQEDPPGEENGNPLEYSCLENSMARGAWQAIVHGVPLLLIQ